MGYGRRERGPETPPSQNDALLQVADGGSLMAGQQRQDAEDELALQAAREAEKRRKAREKKKRNKARPAQTPFAACGNPGTKAHACCFSSSLAQTCGYPGTYDLSVLAGQQGRQVQRSPAGPSRPVPHYRDLGSFSRHLPNSAKLE